MPQPTASPVTSEMPRPTRYSVSEVTGTSCRLGAPLSEVAGRVVGRRAGDNGAVMFREAGPADLGAIVALVESAYRGESSRAGWTTEADLLDGQRTDRAA